MAVVTRFVNIATQLLQDTRFAVRLAAKQPGTTAIIVLSLTLGIGANTMIFSLVNAILLRTLPYPEPDRLVMLWVTPPDRPDDRRGLATAAMCMDVPTRGTFYTSAGCYIAVNGNVSDPPDQRTTGPEWLRGEMLTFDAARALGVKPLMGRWFTAGEDSADAHRVMLISFNLWQRRFNGAADVLGRRLRVVDFGGNDQPSTIIGVMPPGFSFANIDSDYFVPLRPTGRLRRSPVRNRWIVARLAPGVTLEQAQLRANQLAVSFERDAPINKGWGIRVEPVSESLVGWLRQQFQILQGTAFLVLLIACANVGGLLLAQGASRQRELAVRAALGSGRWRIVRQLITESVVLAGIGAALCIATLSWGLTLVVKWLPDNLPHLADATLDSRVLLFTVVVSLATALVFGTLPALQSSRLDLTTAFKSGDRSVTAAPSRLRLRSMFVVMQISLALVLLAGAGLLINSLLRLYNVPIGFDPTPLTVLRMDFSGREFFGSTGKVTPSGSTEMELSPRIDIVATAIRRRLAAIPGVEGATTIGLTAPLNGGSASYEFTIDGRQPPTAGRDAMEAMWYPVGPNYFHVLGTPPLRGRDISERDSSGSVKVALINEAMARRYFPGEDPIGKRISIQFYHDGPRQIVGIVPDIRSHLRQRAIEPEMFVPYAQLPQFQEGRTAFGLQTIAFVVRSHARIEDWLPAARAAARALDPAHAISSVLPLREFATQQTSGFRQYVVLLGAFSGIALLLAAVGIYGVMSHSVIQRTGEIGIRMAFGATPADVLRRVLGRGVAVIATGMAIGLAASLALTRVIASALWDVTQTDPVTFAVVVSTLAVVSFLACYVPARRALKIDPLVAMRYD
jgi:putative ABC transport system permease protein